MLWLFWRANPLRNSGILKRCYHLHDKKRNNDALLKHLQSKIKFSGPITVHEFMKEVLTNPVSGYYMKKNVFGEEGDFITSPEVSQMFGELLGIWIYNEWQKMGAPTPFQLVEFGPGSGSLMKDVLRTFRQLKIETTDIEIHLVEKSPFMSNLQEETLCKSLENKIVDLPKDLRSTYKSSHTSEGIPIYWHYHFSCVPPRFSMMFAHEFFDALPIHKLKKTEDGWREILVDMKDMNEEEDSEVYLRYVISRGPTPASKLYVDAEETRSELEVCPEGGILLKEISSCIKENGGAFLVVDYGHFGTEGDTLRAYRRHAQVNPLAYPGDCDITYDVDFSYLKKQVGDHVITFGPVNQGFFLKNMGIELRLKKLLQFSNESNHRNLISGYNMLVERQQMGERFKVMAFLPAVMKKVLLKYPPAGFYRSFTGE